jgi:hypothetical protein
MVPRSASLLAVSRRHRHSTFSTLVQPNSLRSASSVTCHSYPASGSPKRGGPSSRTRGVPSSSNCWHVAGQRRKRLPRVVFALVYALETSALVLVRFRPAASETIILKTMSSRTVEDLGTP